VIEDVANRAILLVEGSIAKLGEPKEVNSRVHEGVRRHRAVRCSRIGEPVVVARDLVKRYISVDRGVVKAVNGVTFDVATKEIFGIIGKSGAGKTTLSGIHRRPHRTHQRGDQHPYRFEEWIDMTKPGIEQRGRATAYIGLLHQEYDLFLTGTVLDNLTDAIGLEFPKELAMRKALVTLKMAGFTTRRARRSSNRMPAQRLRGRAAPGGTGTGTNPGTAHRDPRRANRYHGPHHQDRREALDPPCPRGDGRDLHSRLP